MAVIKSSVASCDVIVEALLVERIVLFNTSSLSVVLGLLLHASLTCLIELLTGTIAGQVVLHLSVHLIGGVATSLEAQGFHH